MNSGSETYYFESEADAREAQSALASAGYNDVEVHGASGSGGETFMDRVREFFGAAPSDDHEGTAFLVVHNAGDDVDSVVQQYNGRMRPDAYSDASSRDVRDSDVADTTDEQRLRLHEERLNVNKQAVTEGEVRVGKDVVTEHQSIDVPVTREEVYIERRPVTDGTATDADFEDTDQEVRIPVTHEEVQVTKRPVTTEEVIVGKRRVEETQTVGADVRRERARVDRGDVEDRSLRDGVDSSDT